MSLAIHAFELQKALHRKGSKGQLIRRESIFPAQVLGMARTRFRKLHILVIA